MSGIRVDGNHLGLLDLGRSLLHLLGQEQHVLWTVNEQNLGPDRLQYRVEIAIEAGNGGNRTTREGPGQVRGERDVEAQVLPGRVASKPFAGTSKSAIPWSAAQAMVTAP